MPYCLPIENWWLSQPLSVFRPYVANNDFLFYRILNLLCMTFQLYHCITSLHAKFSTYNSMMWVNIKHLRCDGEENVVFVTNQGRSTEVA